jgi:hypothetical protein
VKAVLPWPYICNYIYTMIIMMLYFYGMEWNGMYVETRATHGQLNVWVGL